MNMQEFMEREREKAKRNRIKNRPIVLMTYVMVLTFLAMFGYVIYFVATNLYMMTKEMSTEIILMVVCLHILLDITAMEEQE